MPDKVIFDAEIILKKALEKHKNMLHVLVAETAIWANPEVHNRLINAGSAARYPKIRRAKVGNGERKGQIVSDIRFDDNSYANNVIKKAIGVPPLKIRGYVACHIWDRTCYDERYHTAIANLVLLPSPLAGLTDHHAPTKKALQYRSYELYKWHPEEHPLPIKPEGYVTCWREPEPDTGY